MGYVKPAVITRYPLPSDPTYWVELRDRISYGAMRSATAAGVTVNAASGEASADATKIMDSLALAYVSGWNVDDEAGNVVPVSAEALAALVDVDGKFISEYASDRLNAKASEQKN